MGQGEPHPSSLVLELVSCLSSSAVLEHAARGVLQLAGWLQQGASEAGEGWEAQGSGRGGVAQQQQQAGPGGVQVDELHECALAVAAAYQKLTSLTASLGLSDGEVADSVSLDPSDTAPFLARWHELGPVHTSLLHRALSGPCVRHLVQCMGLRTLCALDGGPTYGVPEGAGMQWLPYVTALSYEPPQQPVLLRASSQLDFLTLLAMSPCDPDADAEPPGRGMRLRLTMRVARAAMAAAGGAGVPDAAGDGNAVRFAMAPGTAGLVAVQALHFAWRHMPPPEGRGGSRRRAALREWAAMVGEVAGSALVPSMEQRVACRLGLLLGAHPDLLRPATADGAFW